MKDNEGTELVAKDLVMVTIETPITRPAEVVIFIENEPLTVREVDADGAEITRNIDNLKYYPITDEGLEVANADNGNAATTIHREKKYILSNVEPKHLLKMSTANLRGYNKVLYDAIVAQM